MTPPSGPARLRPVLTAAARVEIVMPRGGQALGGACEGQHFHDFNGLDVEVEESVPRFVASLLGRR